MSSSGRPLLLLFCFACGVMGADWPQFRGPNFDGSSPELIRTNWVERPPKELWRKPIGPGWSSIAVSGGRVFTQERREDREFCVALDAATGNPIWAVDVETANYTDGSGYSDQVDGPRTTPTVDGNFVYVLTSFLKLYCLRADSGVEVWKRDFMAELGAEVIPWENASSPLVVGDLIYLNVNAGPKRLMAVRKSDGDEAWRDHDFGLTHASPTYGVIDGVPQVIFLTRSGLVSVAPLTGVILWRLNFSPSTTSTAASPAIAGNYVYASAAYGSGTWIAQVTQSNGVFTATQATYQRGVFYQSHWATPVEVGGLFFTVPAPFPEQGRLACLDPRVGTNRWTQQLVGSGAINYGNVIKTPNALVVLTEAGELVTVQPNIGSYVETSRFKVLSAYCWNIPVISSNRLFVRNSSLNSEIVALDVKPAAIPLPPFGLVVRKIDPTHLRISAFSYAGRLLELEHAARVELLAGATVGAPVADWTRLSAPFSFSEGGLHVEIPIENVAGRFLVVHDKEAP